MAYHLHYCNIPAGLPCTVEVRGDWSGLPLGSRAFPEFVQAPATMPEEMVVKMLDDAYGDITAATLESDSLLKSFVQHLASASHLQQALEVVVKHCRMQTQCAVVQDGVGDLAAVPLSWREHLNVRQVRALSDAIRQ